MSHSYRPSSLSFSSDSALSFLDFPRLILGQFYGTWTSGSSWGPGALLENGRAGSQGYVGLVTLFFAAFALFKTKTTRFFAITSVVF
jgi:hypothetical protein